MTEQVGCHTYAPGCYLFVVRGLALGMGGFEPGPSHVDDHHGRPDYQHGEREFLSSCKRPQVKSDLCVRFSNKFNEKAKQAIKRQQRPEDRAAMEVFPVKPAQYEEQQKPFQHSLIEL